MDKHVFIAFDLGAESGRTILGTLADDRLSIQQITRFANEMKMVDRHLHWDVDSLFHNIKKGLRACSVLEDPPESLGVDTWGVDYGLVGNDGSLMEMPYAYRDHRTDGMMEEFFRLVPRRRIYELTGIQFMQLNTLFQLYAHVQETPKRFEGSVRLLFMPDIFNYLLSGVMKTEFTISTTSQLLNPSTKQWERELLSALRIPPSAMQEIVQPGTPLGSLRQEISKETSVGDLTVSAIASHDTASAIAAIPAEGDDWAYISSGTWSLMGVESRNAIISQEAMESNFTNEGGIAGTFRFLKNIMGLWLLQQCRKEWLAGAQFSYEDLMHRAEKARPFRSLIDPDFADFFNPPSMSTAIQGFCQRTGQPGPADQAEFVRCILESLALKYRMTFEQLQRLTARSIARIHIIGGGALNDLLCQFTANATGVQVLAGPAEATAIGNIMVQAMAAGYVGSAEGVRKVVRESFTPVSFFPKNVDLWQEAYDRYKIVLSRNR